ncbi:MAG: hypothetical protein ACE366_05805 [Bradymonadia bacterium]
MGEVEFFGTPTPTHIVYIPFILLVGGIIGFIFGRKAGIKAGQSDLIGAGLDDEGDDLI